MPSLHQEASLALSSADGQRLAQLRFAHIIDLLIAKRFSPQLLGQKIHGNIAIDRIVQMIVVINIGIADLAFSQLRPS